MLLSAEIVHIGFYEPDIETLPIFLPLIHIFWIFSCKDLRLKGKLVFLEVVLDKMFRRGFGAVDYPLVLEVVVGLVIA